MLSLNAVAGLGAHSKDAERILRAPRQFAILRVAFLAQRAILAVICSETIREERVILRRQKKDERKGIVSVYLTKSRKETAE
jgi:hypothetical protein